jgi:hypothetical protein
MTNWGSMREVKVSSNKKCCKVSWCNEPKALDAKAFCDTHQQYKQYAINATVRPWLMYKVEKVLSRDLICEHCGDDMVKKYPKVPLEVILSQMDVDHINSDIKGTLEGEQPSNYQLLCRMCHGIKTYEERDFIAKKYK